MLIFFFPTLFPFFRLSAPFLQILSFFCRSFLLVCLSYFFTGLENVSKYPDLLTALADDGWTDEELEKLAGKNLLRVLKVCLNSVKGAESEHQVHL